MLFTYEDIEAERNIGLTDPQGQAIATSLIAAVTSWAEKVLGYPLEAVSRNAYFDEGERRLYLPTKAPVSAATVSTFNTVTTSYEAVPTNYVRFSEDGVVDVSTWLPCGFQAVKVAFTSGWTDATIPRDLRGALMDLVTIKLQEINNLSVTDPGESSEADPTTGALKKVQTLSYTEEYDTSGSQAVWKAKAAQYAKSIGDNVPTSIMDVLTSYRRAWAA